MYVNPYKFRFTKSFQNKSFCSIVFNYLWASSVNYVTMKDRCKFCLILVLSGFYNTKEFYSGTQFMDEAITETKHFKAISFEKIYCAAVHTFILSRIIFIYWENRQNNEIKLQKICKQYCEGKNMNCTLFILQ